MENLTRKLFYLLFICLSLNSFYGIGQSVKGFNSWLPAPNADDALLIGNGTMGAMVFGHPHNETIILNHAALYLPTGLPKNPIDQASLLPEIRQLILDGNGTKAATLPVEQSMKEGYGGQIWNDPYIPAFDIKIKSTPENIEYYKRSLDFESGEALVKWNQKGNQFERRQFMSRTDSMLVLSITAQHPFDVEIIIDRRPVAWNQWDYINSTIKNTLFYAKGNELFYSSEFSNQWAGNIAGYRGVGKVMSSDGQISAEGNSLLVKNATRLLFLVKIETYKKDEILNLASIQQKLDEVNPNYNDLLARHKKIHTELFNRVSFTLNANQPKDSSDAEVMMLKAKEENTTSFVEKLFYASRYNILSATGKNPPNLQGIWGDSWQPPWSADYTHDGNLPVAISSFMMSNQPELMQSYFDYHDARIPYYRDNALKLYGCRGIQIPGHSSSHGWNVHFDKTWCLSFWNGGAAWASHFYFDYWLYTNNIQFLKNRAYPFMVETALFYEDFLTLDDKGKYVFNPSYSPENNPANNPSQATINATMDVMLAKELFRNLITAANVLGEEKQQITKWTEILNRLPDYEVDSSGVLREWLWPGYTENHAHRHVSQLYGMYDRIDPEIASDSVLLEGVRKALYERMKVRRTDKGGIMVFGLVQMAWVAANLGDAELESEIIHWLSSQYWSNSLASFHDPNGLFNMDLSGGYQTVICKALVYSEPGYLAVFPAKPKEWKDGSISGLKARGQIEIENLSWDSESATIEIVSGIDQRINLKLPYNAYSIKSNTGNGKIYDFNSSKGEALIELKKDERIKLEIKYKIE